MGEESSRQIQVIITETHSCRSSESVVSEGRKEEILTFSGQGRNVDPPFKYTSQFMPTQPLRVWDIQKQFILINRELVLDR
jgi:hypothetical protein